MRKKAFNQAMEHRVEKIMEEYSQEMVTDYIYDTTDKNDARVLRLSKEEYEAMKQIEGEILMRLEIAVKQNLSPNSMEAVEIAKLHKRWLGYTWTDYSKKAHLGLADSFLTDKNFNAYYDKNIKGCAVFLRTAIRNYLFNEADKEFTKSDLNQ